MTNYIDCFTEADTEAKKLKILINNLSVDNFQIISDCTTYTVALKTLNDYFVKKVKSIVCQEHIGNKETKS